MGLPTNEKLTGILLMNRPHRTGLIAALCISGIITNDLPAAEVRQPNVVFFLVDDLRLV
jgi:hypothetical protein